MLANIHFIVVRKDRWKNIISGETPSIDDIQSRFVSNEDIWIIRTYLELKVRGGNPTIGEHPEKDSINIIDNVTAGSKGYKSGYFYVACRTDGYIPRLSQCFIRQNTLDDGCSNSFFIPQWAQPGIISRDCKREGISTLAFFGQPKGNLAESLQTSAFMNALRERGLKFIIRGKSDTNVSWNDYSDIDLIIAVRDINLELLKTKPISKVSNGWLAGVPTIVGEEPVLQAVKEHELDFLVARNSLEVLDVIDKLLSQPVMYQGMLSRCKVMATKWNDEQTAQQWIEQLTCIETLFTVWQGKSLMCKKIEFYKHYIQHKVSKFQFKQKQKRMISKMELNA